MGDSGLWVAGLTAATAIVASWVAGRGHTRAARVQAEAAAEVQEAARRRVARRDSYLAFVEQTHLMGVEYREVPSILKIEDQGERKSALERHQQHLRSEFGRFRHCVQLVALDGGAQTIEAAYAVSDASRAVYMALGEIAEGTREATTFHLLIDAYWRAVTAFVEAARAEQS